MAETAEEKAARLGAALGGEPDPQPGEPGGPEGGQGPPAPEQEPAGQGPAQQDGQGSSKPPWGEDFDAEKAWGLIQTQRTSEDRLKEQVRTMEREKMSEIDRAKAERDDAVRERDELRTQNLKTTVAAAKGLPADAIEFLHGTTQEELEQSADKLNRLKGNGGSTPAPDFGAGARPNGGQLSESENFSATLRRAAGRPA